MLTFREKRIVFKLLKDSPNSDTTKWHEWGYSFLFALGGVVIVLVCLQTLNSLSAESIKYVLIPGVTAGLAILFGGAYGLHITRQFEERKVLAGVLKKLMV